MSWNRRSAGSPPTLWWVLIFWAVLVSDVADSMTSGYSVPWVRKSIRPEFRRLLLEDPDELVADDPALLLGVLDAGQPFEEAAARVDHDEAHPEIAFEGDPEQLRFLLAHQAVVDVDAGQPIAHGAMDERRRDGRVDAARQGADDQPVRPGLGGVPIDPLADPGDGRVDEVGRGPGRRDARDVHDEVAQDVTAAGGMDHLGMELDPVQVALRGGQAGMRRGIRLGGRAEPLGQPGDGVAVAHPDGLLALDAGEEPVRHR